MEALVAGAGSAGQPSVRWIMRLARGEMLNAPWKVMQYFCLVGLFFESEWPKRLRNGYDQCISPRGVA